MAATERDVTTVEVKRPTHRRLSNLKEYGQSFDDLIDEMADVFEEHRTEV